jgi:hypothetical protein
MRAFLLSRRGTGAASFAEVLATGFPSVTAACPQTRRPDLADASATWRICAPELTGNRVYVARGRPTLSNGVFDTPRVPRFGAGFLANPRRAVTIRN